MHTTFVNQLIQRLSDVFMTTVDFIQKDDTTVRVNDTFFQGIQHFHFDGTAFLNFCKLGFRQPRQPRRRTVIRLTVLVDFEQTSQVRRFNLRNVNCNQRQVVLLTIFTNQFGFTNACFTQQQRNNRRSVVDRASTNGVNSFDRFVKRHTHDNYSFTIS